MYFPLVCVINTVSAMWALVAALPAALTLIRAPRGLAADAGRSAKWSDACAALDATCFPPEGLWRSAQYAEELHSEHGEVIGAWQGSEMLRGVVCCRRIVDETHLLMLLVHPEWRGRSLGETLLRTALRSAWDARDALLTLEVRESNGAALALYSKCGLREVGRRRNYYNTPQEDALLLTAHLERDVPPAPPLQSLGACGATGGQILSSSHLVCDPTV